MPHDRLVPLGSWINVHLQVSFAYVDELLLVSDFPPFTDLLHTCGRILTGPGLDQVIQAIVV